MSPLIRHPKKRGEWVEMQFMARAAAHGFTVSKPWGDSARYDFAIEHNGVFHRVQVKSTSYQSAKGRKAYLANTISRPPQRKPNMTQALRTSASEGLVPTREPKVSEGHGFSRAVTRESRKSALA